MIPFFICRPNSAVKAGERCTGTLLSAKANRAVEQTIDEPLKTDRHFVEAIAATVFAVRDVDTFDCSTKPFCLLAASLCGQFGRLSEKEINTRAGKD